MFKRFFGKETHVGGGHQNFASGPDSPFKDLSNVRAAESFAAYSDDPNMREKIFNFIGNGGEVRRNEDGSFKLFHKGAEVYFGTYMPKGCEADCGLKDITEPDPPEADTSVSYDKDDAMYWNIGGS